MIVGFPCSMGDEHASIGNRAALPIESEGWLPGVMLYGLLGAQFPLLMLIDPKGRIVATGLHGNDIQSAVATERAQPLAYESKSHFRLVLRMSNPPRQTCGHETNNSIRFGLE
jgi:hypothetical protein